MKISGHQRDSFLHRPGPEIRAVLVFGPDRGLVSESAEKLVRSSADDPTDPFRVSELTGAQLKENPSLLRDEASALSLTGGARAVWVRDSTDVLSGLFKDFISSSDDASLVVVEARELSSRSSLRKAFESAKNAAALGCYPDEGSGLEGVILSALKEHGLNATPEAVAFLCSRLGGDRLVVRSELAKLALYVSGGDGGSATVALDDAVAGIGDSGAVSLDDVAFAVGDGDQGALDGALERAYAEGMQAVGILRAVQRHLQRLHLVARRLTEGETVDGAMAELRPPVFYKFKNRFRCQVGNWPPDRLGRALDLLVETEIDCKSTGMPVAAICSRALVRIAQGARAGSSKREAGRARR